MQWINEEISLYRDGQYTVWSLCIFSEYNKLHVPTLYATSTQILRWIDVFVDEVAKFDARV